MPVTRPLAAVASATIAQVSHRFAAGPASAYASVAPWATSAPSGQCLVGGGASETARIDAGETPTFGIFVGASEVAPSGHPDGRAGGGAAALHEGARPQQDREMRRRHHRAPAIETNGDSTQKDWFGVKCSVAP